MGMMPPRSAPVSCQAGRMPVRWRIQGADPAAGAASSGGMVSCALDSACGAAFSLMPDDAAVLTVEFKINLRPGAQAPSASGACRRRVAAPSSVVDGRATQPGEDGAMQRRSCQWTATVAETVRGRQAAEKETRHRTCPDSTSGSARTSTLRDAVRNFAARDRAARRRDRPQRPVPHGPGARWASSACSASPSGEPTAAPAWATSAHDRHGGDPPRLASRWPELRRIQQPVRQPDPSPMAARRKKRYLPKPDQRRARRRAGHERAGPAAA